jgi:hypothetical protein
MIELKHFALSEFDAAGEPGTGQLMRVSTLIKLDKMREAYGKAIIIRHGFRTKTAAFRIQRAHPGAVKNSALAPGSRTMRIGWTSWMQPGQRASGGSA